jgi:O-antigen/teichoic acid export membrane protein
VNLVWILLVGYVTNLILGTNTFALISAGDRRAIVIVNLAGVVTMVVTALVLIPPLGPTGGALATSCSYVIWNAAASTALFRSTGVHPLRADFVVALATSAGVLAAAVAVRKLAAPGSLPAVATWTLVLWGAWVGALVALRALRGSEMRPLVVWGQRSARREFLAGRGADVGGPGVGR